MHMRGCTTHMQRRDVWASANARPHHPWSRLEDASKPAASHATHGTSEARTALDRSGPTLGTRAPAHCSAGLDERRELRNTQGARACTGKKATRLPCSPGSSQSTRLRRQLMLETSVATTHDMPALGRRAATPIREHVSPGLTPSRSTRGKSGKRRSLGPLAAPWAAAPLLANASVDAGAVGVCGGASMGALLQAEAHSALMAPSLLATACRRSSPTIAMWRHWRLSPRLPSR